MTPGKKQAFEPTGLIPRSIVRTFERFYKQLLPKTKYSAIREYRISRYQVLVSIRCLCTLLILPLVTRVITNWLIFSYALPQIKYFWDVTYQDEHVFSEIDQFSQVLFFDSLLDTAPSHIICSTSSLPYSSGYSPLSPVPKTKENQTPFTSFLPTVSLGDHPVPLSFEPKALPITYGNPTVQAKAKVQGNPESGKAKITSYPIPHTPYPIPHTPSGYRGTGVQGYRGTGVQAYRGKQDAQNLQSYENKTRYIGDEINRKENKNKQDQALQNKIFELAESSHFHALQSVTNVFADLSSILVLVFLLITLKPEITILKSFLVEVIYNLSDTTKSFLLILMTDLLVGFHSPRGWETMFSLILHHFGLPENQDFVFLFVATLPVILDTVFKYWIFRHLNKISPSTVATYHNMIE